MKGKVIIVSAPSGAGKTSIVRHLLQVVPKLSFSVSATTRNKRGNEEHGKDYYFFSPEEFRERISKDEFLEWQEVYADQFYGTLKSEVERIWNEGHIVIFDVDVLGGINIKKYFGDKALSVFIQPPTLEELRNRLLNRGTETEESMKKRLDKAEYEISFADQFDKIVLNDDLATAQQEMIDLVQKFIGR